MDTIMEISKRGRRFKLRRSKLISLVYGGVSNFESSTSLSTSLSLLPPDLRSLDELPPPHSRRKISPTLSGITWFVCLSSSTLVKGNSVFSLSALTFIMCVCHVQIDLVS